MSSIFDTLNVSCVFQRRRENSTSMAFWLTSDTSSQAAIVASIEPNRSKLGSDGWSAKSSMMMTESFQNRSVPATLLMW